MAVVVIAGMGEVAGKTALACGLAGHLADRGISVAYAAVGSGADDHAAFVGGALKLAPNAVASAPTPAELALPSAAITLVEMGSELAVADTARALGGTVLLVVRYHQNVTAQQIIDAVGDQRALLAGVVVNAAPPRVILPLREVLVAGLEAAGIRLFGIVPEDRQLMGFTVGELAEHLDAAFLSGQNRRDVLLQALMVGANAADPAFSFFKAKPQTALICRANRPDQQLTALEQPVACMVFTGDGHVQQSVVYRAEDAGVPILAVPTDTIDTVHALDGLVEGTRFRQAAKVPVIQDLVDGRIDWPHFDAAFGL